MAGVAWHYVLKFIITGAYVASASSTSAAIARCAPPSACASPRRFTACHQAAALSSESLVQLSCMLLMRLVCSTGDAAVGKSPLLVRLTDQRFLANPDPTVRLALHPSRCTGRPERPLTARCRIRIQTHHHSGREQSGEAAMYVPSAQSCVLQRLTTVA